MKKKSFFLTAVATLSLATATIAQNICQSIGNDSLALLNNGYVIGPNSGGGSCPNLNVHTESKWINVNGTDSIYVNTFQHRLYDFSKIYDQNNNLIWSWLGESVPSTTWYLRHHSVFVGSNDSVRIEFHQGYANPFCNGYLQVIGIHCSVLPNQNICNTIGNDSLSLLNNGYVIGPNSGGGTCPNLNVHTESKWINVNGTDSLYVNTFQHRLYDFSKIYDQNNNLIWSWLGESVPSTTWYLRHHSVFVGSNDSVRIEFHQGYQNPFCNGYLQVVGMFCQNNNVDIIENTSKNMLSIYPNPTSDHITINYGNYATLSGYQLKIINSLGQQLFQTAINQQSSYINLSTWSGNGIYFVQIIDPQGNIIDIRKIVLQ